MVILLESLNSNWVPLDIASAAKRGLIGLNPIYQPQTALDVASYIAKVANLSIEDTNKLNQFNESLQRLENVTKSFTSAEYGKKVEALEEVTKLRELLTQQFQSRKNDDTITYF